MSVPGNFQVFWQPVAKHCCIEPAHHEEFPKAAPVQLLCRTCSARQREGRASSGCAHPFCTRPYFFPISRCFLKGAVSRERPGIAPCMHGKEARAHSWSMEAASALRLRRKAATDIGVTAGRADLAGVAGTNSRGAVLGVAGSSCCPPGSLWQVAECLIFAMC